MRFMPHTEADIASMLDTIGAKSLEDLLAHLPANLRATAKIDLAPGRTEYEVASELGALASRNQGATGFSSFLGGGSFRHYVPAPVRAVTAPRDVRAKCTPHP